MADIFTNFNKLQNTVSGKLCTLATLAHNLEIYIANKSHSALPTSVGYFVLSNSKKEQVKTLSPGFKNKIS